MNNLSPIVLFVYNRPWHTQQTVEALQKNELSSQSELFIYSDGAKNNDVQKSVDKVRTYIDKIEGFKKVTVIKKDKNWGLADSIIDGVTRIVNEYGRIIVLEDDIVTSHYFLKFMNDALNFYQNEEKVFHISGYMFPVDKDDLSDTFFLKPNTCWGWSTWSRAWRFFKKDTDYCLLVFDKNMIADFNLNKSYDYFNQIKLNKIRVINTWAVYWYASMYLNNGLSLHSKDSFVHNIGFDGQGVHCGKINVFDVILTKKYPIDFTSIIEENTVARRKTEDYFRNIKISFFRVIMKKFFKLSALKKIYINEQFNPKFLGVFINPFYFARKGLYQNVAELITNLNGKLLDIGCGTKPYKYLCNVDKYIGLEIEDEGNRNNSFADVFYNGKTIPFKDRTFDSLISSQVFEHVFNPDEFLQEANRVTKIGGVFLITAPFVWDEHEQPYDYARYSSFGLEHILNKYGFKVIKSKKSNNGLEVIFQLINAYIFKVTLTKYSCLNLLATIFLMAPINIIGLIFSKISPRNNDLYLDNIVLAEKFKDV